MKRGNLMGFMDIFRASAIREENEKLKKQLQDLGATEYYQVKEKITALNQEIRERQEAADNELKSKADELNETIVTGNATISRLHDEIESLTAQNIKLDKQLRTQTNKLARAKELYSSVEYAMDNFLNAEMPYSNCKLSRQDFSDYDLISPSVILKLHCMDVKDLRKAYRENQKQISKLLDQ